MLPFVLAERSSMPWVVVLRTIEQLDQSYEQSLPFVSDEACVTALIRCWSILVLFFTVPGQKMYRFV